MLGDWGTIAAVLEIKKKIAAYDERVSLCIRTGEIF
jgi:hypothetical protein